MKQEVDVVTIFNRGSRQPKPIKFRLIEKGETLTVDVFDVLSFDYIGQNRIDYECNALSKKGNLIKYVLEYYRNEGRWILNME